MKWSEHVVARRCVAARTFCAASRRSDGVDAESIERFGDKVIGLLTSINMSELFDVVVVGAGISGISAAWHPQDRCPGNRYVVLERRSDPGGTWDLVKYPGIRSDSDMCTFGFLQALALGQVHCRRADNQELSA